MDIIGTYPVWYEPWFGSGRILGITATIHLLASHTSVGAALISNWLVWLGVKRDRPELIEYVRRYGVFLLVFSYVLGSITGPGIWFSATVASPGGLSDLIHLFVFLWATEWVFFVIEVIAIYLMVYLAGRVDQRSYLNIAWIFGMASWATMLVIVGILSFMLWPGQANWFEQGGSLAAFFGPYTFAQIFSRTCFMLMAAALAGGLIAAGMDDPAIKREMITTLSKLGIPAALLGALGFQYGLTTIPESAEVMLKTKIPIYFAPALWITLLVTIGYFAALLARPEWLTRKRAASMMLILLIFGIWPEEMSREALRKPYIYGQCTYPNGVIACDIPHLDISSQLPLLSETGLLKANSFIPKSLHQITPDNQLEAGQAIAIHYCSSCHGLGNRGPRPFSKMFGGQIDVGQIQRFLLGTVATGNIISMPNIPMSEDEAHALASFIAALPLYNEINP